MGAKEVSAFLTHLAVEGRVAASTQNQALSALLFLYREVLEREFGWLDDVVRAKKPKHLPVVFTPEEAMAIIGELSGRARWLMGMQLYGGGLRLNECLRQRVKDLDFERLQVMVRDGKGEKDRVTLLPRGGRGAVEGALGNVRKAHERALAEGYAGVELPYALARKYPNADREWGWQYVYPADRPSRDPRSGAWRGITWTSRSCRRRCMRRSESWVSRNRPAATPFVILSPRICWPRGRISAPCKSCWGTRT